MSKSNDWYGYVLHNRKFQTVYYVGNRPNETRDSLRGDLMNYASTADSLVVGTIKASTCDEAMTALKDGGWDDDTLPLNGEERAQAAVSIYQRIEVKGPYL